MADLCLLPPSLIRKFNRTQRRFGAIAACIAAAVAITPLAALAQTTAGGSPVSAQQTGVSENGGVSLPQRNGLTAAQLRSGPLMLLPEVYYDTGGFGAASPTLADVNGDGKLDIVVPLHSSNSVGVLLGNGDGTFQTAKTYNTGFDNPLSVAVADVNGDGRPDLLVANAFGATSIMGTVAVLLGNGDGTFQPEVSYASGGYLTNSIAVADVNNDGKLDIVVASWCPDSNCSSNGVLGVLLGKGDGTFEPAKTYDSGSGIADSVVIADLNHDGRLDLVVANGCRSTANCVANKEVAVLLGKGDGTFQAAVTYGSGGFIGLSIAVADVNGDGKLDLLVANACSTGACADTDTTIGVLLGNGDGTFQPAVPYDSGGKTANSMTADMNGDGKLDLVVGGCGDTNSCDHNFGNVALLFGNGDGTFQPATTYFAGIDAAGALAVGDLNGDHKPDVVIAHLCTVCSPVANDGMVGVMLNNYGAPQTTTSLVSSKNPVTFRQMVTYTATVAGQSGGTLSGTVTFADANTPIATVTLTSNKAVYSTSYKQFGSHPITASYSGAFRTAEGSRSVMVTESVLLPSTTTATTSGSPTFVGQPVTFTATASSSYGPIPDGELVKFYDGTTLLASVPLASETAKYTTSSLSGKTHGIRAIYVGDTKFISSIGFVTQVVQLYSTTTTLSSSPNPSKYGQAVTIKATVKSAGPTTPTGKVVFRDGTTWIGAANLSGGVATIIKSSLAVGTHSITGAYSGDGMSAGSTSPALNQVVQ
jgi:hypothetical protein